MNLDFLNNVELDAVVPKTRTAKTQIDKLPTDADIRVFSNGKVYPSEAFATANGLEYGARIKEGDKVVAANNGIDIFDSTRWGMIAGKLPQELIFCAIVPKKLPKVDLWSSCTYNEDGSPKSSVLTQGNQTFVRKQFMPMLKTIYGIDWDTTAYVDLKVDTEHVVASSNNIYHLPKVISGGKFKGEDSYIRREGLSIHPLTVAHTEPAIDKQSYQLAMFDKPIQVSSFNEEVKAPTYEKDIPVNNMEVVKDTPDEVASPTPFNADVPQGPGPESPVDNPGEGVEDDGMDWAKGLGDV